MIQEKRRVGLVISWLLTDKLDLYSQRDNKNVSSGCLHVCNNNVYNSEQWMVNIVHENEQYYFCHVMCLNNFKALNMKEAKITKIALSQIRTHAAQFEGKDWSTMLRWLILTARSLWCHGPTSAWLISMVSTRANIVCTYIQIWLTPILIQIEMTIEFQFKLEEIKFCASGIRTADLLRLQLKFWNVGWLLFLSTY